MAHNLAIPAGRIVTISGFRTDAKDVSSPTANIVMPGGTEPHCHTAQESGRG